MKWLLSLVCVLLLFAVPFAQAPEPSETPIPPVTVGQAEATQPGVPPASVPPSETLSWMFAFGVMSNWAMRKLKEAS